MAGGRLSECPCGPALGGSKRPDQWGEGAHIDRVLSGSHTHSTPPSQRSPRVVVHWGLAGLLDSVGRPSSAGSVLRLVTRRISHPLPGLSPLGSHPRYCCLPRSLSEVLGPGLLATNLKPTLTSPFAGSQNNLQSIVQRRNTANRGLTNCNAKQPMRRMHWCSHRFTSCNATGHPAAQFTQSCALERSITQKGRRRRGKMQPRRHFTECPSRHTPIAGSQACWDAHWALERWAQCCSITLVAQLHPGRDAVQGCVTSTI